VFPANFELVDESPLCRIDELESCSTGLEGHHLSIPLALDNELTARTCPGSGLESGPACQQEPDANR
jgi:hypothetical protein